MNSPVPWLSRLCGVLAISIFSSSCGDDPLLVSKREEQRAEISRLEGELDVLQERMEQLPPDRSAEVAELKQDAENNRAEIATLESEIEALEKEKAAIEKEHEAYRRKYVVR